MKKIKVERLVDLSKLSKEAKMIMEAIKSPDGESKAYKEAKAIDMAYILEDGWIVRVFADGHKEKIKYVGTTKDWNY